MVRQLPGASLWQLPKAPWYRDGGCCQMRLGTVTVAAARCQRRLGTQTVVAARCVQATCIVGIFIPFEGTLACRPPFPCWQVLRYMAALNKTRLPSGMVLLSPDDAGRHAHASSAPLGDGPVGGGSGSRAAHGGPPCCGGAVDDWVAQVTQLLRPPLLSATGPLLAAWVGMCGGWYSTVLWIPEYFKRRGAPTGSIYAETFAVAAANLPGARVRPALSARLHAWLSGVMAVRHCVGRCRRCRQRCGWLVVREWRQHTTSICLARRMEACRTLLLALQATLPASTWWSAWAGA